MATKIDCPKEVRPELDIKRRTRSENSRVASCHEYLKFYELIQDNGECFIIDSAGQTPKFDAMQPDFQFVILREKAITPNAPDSLKLILSKGPHDTIAKHAESAAAAGDAFASYDASGRLKIFKVTDQSGSFYIPNTDPHFGQKQSSARAAMKAVGLPMDKFQPFGTPTALVFSSTLRDINRVTKKDLTEKEAHPKNIRETITI